MRINLNIDYFRPNPPACRLLAYPANIHFDWQRWVAEGLMDEGVLRFFELPFECIFQDDVARDMIRQCQQKGIPLSVNRYVRTDRKHLDEFKRIRNDGRFCGFVLYETKSFTAFNEEGECSITSDVVNEICRYG